MIRARGIDQACIETNSVDMLSAVSIIRVSFEAMSFGVGNKLGYTLRDSLDFACSSLNNTRMAMTMN